MKIGITCYPTYGGSGVVATELGIELANRGHEIHFICYDRPYRLPAFHKNIFYHEVQVSKYPLFEYPPYSLALASKMVEVVNNHDIEILHAHYAIPHATSAYLAKEILNGKIKIITTLHGTDITIVGADPSFFNITKFSMEKSDMLTSVSNYLKEETQKTFKIENKIEVIYNFYNPKLFESSKAGFDRAHFAGEFETIFTHISNFRPVKRIDDVINIFYKVQKHRPSKLLMVGDGPERSVAEKMVTELKISEKVIFLGKQSDIINILNVSDIFLFPSDKESFGLAALEAMITGTPVIGSNAGGVKEVVEHDINGFLSETGDTDDMSQNAIRLIDDKQLYKRFAEAGKKIASDRFESDKIIEKYIHCYEKLLNS